MNRTSLSLSSLRLIVNFLKLGLVLMEQSWNGIRLYRKVTNQRRVERSILQE